MQMENIRQKMRRVQWNANKRTIEKRPIVPHHVKEEANVRLAKGDYEGARDLIESQEEGAVARDHAALITLGLVHFGQQDYEGALETFEKAEAAIDHIRARILLNKANVLKVQKRFDEALRVAEEVRELAPQWNASHLMMIAVLECRDAGADRAATRESVSHMKSVWPAWKDDPEFWRYLMIDVDYARLRNAEEFSAMFGHPPQEGNENE